MGWNNLKWSFIESWLINNEQFLFKLYNKHSYKNGDDTDDVKQEIYLFLDKYLDEKHLEDESFNPFYLDVKEQAELCAYMEQKYRRKVWGTRDIHSLRMSDLYTFIQPGSDKDEHIQTLSLSETSNLERISELKPKDAITNSYINNIIQKLLELLPKNAKEYFILNLLGNSNEGYLTQEEIAEKYNKTRFAITDNIKYSKNIFKKIFKNSNIKLDDILNGDMVSYNTVMELIEYYKKSKQRQKTIKVTANDNFRVSQENILTYMTSLEKIDDQSSVSSDISFINLANKISEIRNNHQ